jgi:tetratricopeptide (TPR) repeat protein
MFSPYHGLDLFNFAILLLSPAILLVAVGGRALQTGFGRSPEGRFLLSGLLPVIAFLLVAKFDLGAAKDWDVCAPYAFLAALFAVALVFRESSAVRRGAVLLAAILALLQTAAYVRVNAGSAVAVRRYDALLDRRTMSNVSFYAATLHLASYYHQVNDTLAPADLWQRYVVAFPQDARGYQNLIANSTRFGPSAYGRIMTTYEQWLGMNPTDTVALITYAGFCLDAGNERYGNGSLEEAARFYERAVALDPFQERACNNLGSIYAQRGDLPKAIEFFQRAILLDSTYSDPYYNLGSAYEDRGEKAKGLGFKKQAARLGNAAAQTQLQQQHIAW